MPLTLRGEGFRFALVHRSVCSHYQNGIGGHLTVNGTKENNIVYSVTIEKEANDPSVKQKKITKEMAPNPISAAHQSVPSKNFVAKMEK